MRFLFIILIVFCSLPVKAESCREYLDRLHHERRAAQMAFSSPQRTKTFRLPNGLEVLVVSDPKAQKAVANLSVGVGSMEDPLHHMGFFRALGRTLAETQELKNSAVGVKVEENHTNLSMTVPAESLRESLRQLAERVLVNGIPPAARVPDETQILKNLWQRIEQDVDLQGRWLRRMIRGGRHPYSRSPIELASGLLQVRSFDLTEALGKYFFPGNMKLVLIGPMSLAELERVARDSFRKEDHRPALVISYPNLPTSYEQRIVRWQTQGYQHADVMDVVISLDPVRNEWPQNSLATIVDILNRKDAALANEFAENQWIESYKVSLVQKQFQRDLVLSLRLKSGGTEHYEEILRKFNQVLVLMGMPGGTMGPYLMERQAQQEHTYRSFRWGTDAATARELSEILWNGRLNWLEKQHLTPVVDMAAFQHLTVELLVDSRRQIFLGSPREIGVHQVTPWFPVSYGYSGIQQPQGMPLQLPATPQGHSYESDRSLLHYTSQTPATEGAKSSLRTVFRAYVQDSEVADAAMASFGAYYYDQLLQKQPGSKFYYRGEGQFILEVSGETAKDLADHKMELVVSVLGGPAELSEEALSGLIDLYADSTPSRRPAELEWLRRVLTPSLLSSFMKDVISGSRADTEVYGVDSTQAMTLHVMLAMRLFTGSEVQLAKSDLPKVTWLRRVSGATAQTRIFIPVEKDLEYLKTYLQQTFAKHFVTDSRFNAEVRWIERRNERGFEWSLQTTEHPEIVGRQIHEWMNGRLIEDAERDEKSNLESIRGIFAPRDARVSVYVLGSQQLRLR